MNNNNHHATGFVSLQGSWFVCSVHTGLWVEGNADFLYRLATYANSFMLRMGSWVILV
jgi:hypothetical protein